MDRIQIAPTDKSPEVDFNPAEGVLMLKGRSLVEDSESFYLPLVEWIQKYIDDPKEGTVIDFKFEYFNTSCSKWLITITKELKVLYEKDPSTQINWYYEDDDVLEYGEVICDLVDIPINMIDMEPEEEEL
ncbi:MAG: DUF1987 domain-containing protein [Bacteroidales bacterium]|nr:DUF1987 domain-containing protein [Bacteroidales bacterium]MBR4214967.1 DUF1987 domain-containing protein [Bacteroidales bacterium]